MSDLKIIDLSRMPSACWKAFATAQDKNGWWTNPLAYPCHLLTPSEMEDDQISVLRFGVHERPRIITREFQFDPECNVWRVTRNEWWCRHCGGQRFAENSPRMFCRIRLCRTACYGNTEPQIARHYTAKDITPEWAREVPKCHYVCLTCKRICGSDEKSFYASLGGVTHRYGKDFWRGCDEDTNEALEQTRDPSW